MIKYYEYYYIKFNSDTSYVYGRGSGDPVSYQYFANKDILFMH